MPTYKRADFIKNAINSIVSQTYKNIELIVVDDNILGSKESVDTKMVVDSFNDPRIRYIKNQKNLGGAASRNVGVFNATGKYTAFLDDDDMYLPEKVDVQYHKMLEEDWDVCAMDGATYKFETGELATEHHQQIHNGMSLLELQKAHLIHHITGTNSFMFKTSFLQEIGGFDDVPSCHEYFLVQKALDHNSKFGYIPQILIKNFVHDGEQISTGDKKLQGLHLLYDNKKKYFHLLTRKEQNIVSCRYYGALFYVYYKRKVWAKAIRYAFKSFFLAPRQTLVWMCVYWHKIFS